MNVYKLELIFVGCYDIYVLREFYYMVLGVLFSIWGCFKKRDLNFCGFDY